MAASIHGETSVNGSGRIGPNSVIRVIEALDAFENRAFTTRVFSSCGIERYLETAPDAMVDEGEVTALHGALHQALGDGRARSVAWVAGIRTAEYLLANRIPRAVQRILKVLPAPLASRVLCAAITRNAWTFVGTGRLSVRHGQGPRLIVEHCPICRGAHSQEPYCDFYAATFERLFARLVHPRAKARETQCAARGEGRCVFHVTWSARYAVDRHRRGRLLCQSDLSACKKE